MLADSSILIVGFGSIGRRHFRNLKSLGFNNIIFYRSGNSILPNTELQDLVVEFNLKTALSHKPLAAIISNPTSLHVPIALEAVKSGCHIFMEKPISNTIAKIDELYEIVNKKKINFFTGFQFRFHPAIKKVKSWLDSDLIGDIVSIQAHYGEYLPSWHPWEDYKISYSAQKDLGGGVVFTLCHSIDYLRWFIGNVKSVCALVGNRSGLELEVEDSAQIILEFENGVIGGVYLDYVQRPPQHFFQIIGTEGTIYWDSKNNAAGINLANKNKWKWYYPPSGFERNTLFLEEMRHFLDCIQNDSQPIITIEDGIEVLKILLAIKKSAKEKKYIYVR